MVDNIKGKDFNSKLESESLKKLITNLRRHFLNNKVHTDNSLLVVDWKLKTMKMKKSKT